MKKLYRQKYDVLVVGDYCLDFIFAGLSSQPIMGQEIVSSSFEMIPGGTYNSVIAMHRLGIKVGWAADFGNDHLSRVVLDLLEKEGVSTELFVQHPKPMRKVTVALSYPEDRAFIAYYDPDPPIPSGFKSLSKSQSRLIFIPGLYHGIGMNLGILAARAKGMKIFMDGNHPNELNLKSPQIRKSIKGVDVLLPNASEVHRLTGSSDLLDGIKTLGALVDLLIVKDGKNGSYAFYKGELMHMPAIPVNPLDTTGAGDCFNAGFICGWLSSKDLPTCLQWGNIAGGLSTEKLGGTGRKITLNDLKFLSKRYYK
jgi:sugar/nucleoside kinase (ribokinase family)